MDVQLRVHGCADAHAELASLRRWLSDEPAFRGRASFAPATPEEGEMGIAYDVLMVALGSGGALTMLTSPVSVWLQQRPSQLWVEIEPPDGATKRVFASGRAADVIANKVADHPGRRNAANPRR